MPNRLRWYANRLRTMSSAEVVFRAGQAGRCAGDWWRWITKSTPRLEELLRDLPTSVAAVMTGPVDRPFLPLLDGSGRYALTSDELGETARETVAEAERLLKGDWVLFGQPVQIADAPDWHCDPVTLKRWPRAFYAFVDHRAGGAKFVWELARHQFVGALARAYAWTGDERFAVRAVTVLLSWIYDNPPGEGIHWTSPFECALRLLSWSLVFHATRRSGVWGGEALERFLVSLAVQGRFVESHPSRFSSANNHSLAEAAGLACLGLSFPEFRDADRWRRNGLASLERELLLQIRPDGSGAEQAPYYLACVIDYGLFLHAIATSRGGGLSEACRTRLVAAARFLERLTNGVDEIPHIGDADDGRAVPLDAAGVAAYDAARIGTAALLGVPEIRRPGDPVLERVFWLCGAQGGRAFATMSPGAPGVGSEAFDDGGVVIVADVSARSRSVFDQGPLGYLSIAAHGHSDALAVILDVDRDPLFADAGTFVYHDAPEWRRYFRGTRAHSTVCVAGKDQSESLGDTVWGRQANVTRHYRCLGSTVQCVVASHDGYTELEPPLVHRRALLSVAADYWLIVDWLDGQRTPEAEVLWHLHQSVRIETGGKDRWRVRTRGGAECDILIGGTALLTSRVASGEIKHPLGWASDLYGERHAVAVIAATVAAGDPWVVATVVGRDLIGVKVETVAGGSAIHVHRPGSVDTAVFASPGFATVQTTDLAVSGFGALLRRGNSGTLRGLAVFGGLSVATGSGPQWTSQGQAPKDAAQGVFAGRK